MNNPLLAERDRIAAEVRAIKTGAAQLSQLLAEDLLGADEWSEPLLCWPSVERSESGSTSDSSTSTQRSRLTGPANCSLSKKERRPPSK